MTSLIPGLLLGLVGGSVPSAPPLIFDTDMDTDCDDAGAMAVLHTLADAGECAILATVTSSKFAWSAACVERLNVYFGRPDLPVGAPKSAGPNTGSRGSRYARQIAAEFPGRLGTNDTAPDAVAVYRRALAGQPDGAVTILTVGYVTNLKDLLASEPDEFSELSGRELVARKVKRWVCMGGRYPQHLDPGVFGNFKPDPEAIRTAIARWPGGIWFCGLGDTLQTGRRLAETPATNPIRRIYELYLGGVGRTRPSWDLLATLFAIRPESELFEVHTGGYNHVFENGTNEWRAGEPTNHHLLNFAPGAPEKLRELLEDLLARGPRTG